MSIIDTLVTDRTQADVSSGNAKGTYNAADLNRVSEAMEYLLGLLWEHGYSVPAYQRIKLPRPGHYETHAVTKPVLPDGYTQLEYIKSTGTQYIKTGVIPSNDLVAHFSNFSAPGNTVNYSVFLGSQSEDNANDSWQFRIHPTNNKYLLDIYAQTRVQTDIVENCDIVLDSAGITVNGTKTVFSTTPSIISATYPLWIFASNTGGSAFRPSSASFSSLTLSDASGLLRKYLPAKRNSDSEIGLYDLVTNTFYGNDGTGSFVSGPENIQYETVTDTVFVPDERDPYTWYEEDVPTSGQMAQYIVNLDALRSCFTQAAETPEVPQNMEKLTWLKANDIEQILKDINFLITNITAAWFYSGDLYAGEV